MTIFNQISQEILDDEYFQYLFLKAETLSANNFFQVKEQSGLVEKEYTDLLRFSDLLSRSEDTDAQNKSYKIISLLIDEHKEDALFRVFANSVLTKLGNFPAINLLEKYAQASDKHSVEIVFEKHLKEVYQQTPGNDFIFTDAQYKIFERLKNSNHYSFSGPTSLGKSFILNAFIWHLINEIQCNENIIILVPTRALINQILLQLKKEFSDIKNYKILSHPIVPETFKNENGKFIFVFTPERMISYLSDINNPKIGYLFIDEAQKVISEKDARSPLYYHSILQAERKSIKLYFASPNIPNPEVFLQLFEKSTDEATNIQSAPVAQNRFFLDLLDKRCLMFSDLGMESNINVEFKDTSFFGWLKKLSGQDASIIYCNSRADTIKYALEFSETLPDKEDDKINEVISVIKDHLHEKYFLIDCLKKGVAFHFGNLPQRIREKVETLFSDRIIDYMFCTSTLLEGVNLPAKNIFILNNANGLTKFSDIDFWNLAGRAGRLSKELSGNIICTRTMNKRNRWENPEKDLNVVRYREIKAVKPIISSGRKNFFKNIEASLSEMDFTNKNATENEKKIWDHYANITLIHEIRSDDSALRSNLIGKNHNAKAILQKLSQSNVVPEKILSSYSMIKAKYQNNIYQHLTLQKNTFSSDIGYDSVLQQLNWLYDIYSWETEETGGKNAMCRSKDSLKYYAVLMSSWMGSKPISWIISNSIKYYRQKGEIWDVDQIVPFNSNSKYHINLVINEIISNIDNILRFKLKNYFSNYYEILVAKFGENNAGKNWGEYLEYGTTDYRVIELQNIGIPRHLANFLLETQGEFFNFERGFLVDFDKIGLLEAIDHNSAEFKELLDVI
ncbi:MAG: DEAD/DEAH box helicase [Proteobacteria bacterium]|nr:DEAD/DEAH box helicase [Pseudomonadota bacterium]